jgi:hypothetical protein
MSETRLDRALAAMEAAPEEDAARLAFYDRLAEAELFVLLEAEVTGDAPILPRSFPVEGGPVVLAFDREERLAAFAGGPASYAALSGRALAARLAGQGVALGLNLGSSGETLLPAEALGWLAATLAEAPKVVEARLAALAAPAGLPPALLTALDAKLATAAGLARGAYLAAAEIEGGGRGHLLAFIDAAEGAEAALARAVAEALTFSGLEAAALDVAFLRASDPAAARLARVALRIDLPGAAEPPAPAAPGSDPARPPRLR